MNSPYTIVRSIENIGNELLSVFGDEERRNATPAEKQENSNHELRENQFQIQGE